MSIVSKQHLIKIALFEQAGGWVFIVSDSDFFSDPIYSGKRKTLEMAMSAARERCPEGRSVIYSRIDNLNYDWTF